ncbi:MAG: type II toxin-antitoxin system RelE/ParE family toxin [Gammaproteobacteria bacterium]|nr:MAG: type II toxin-antitoxin system RelE/ParE family toxin [Gammaproteobacteria bacterium]
MGLYKIEWALSAKKELRKINKQDILKIINQVEKLSINPYPHNHIKYIGADYTYRIRVGNYRVIYSVYQEKLTVKIVKVGHRQNVYKK